MYRRWLAVISMLFLGFVLANSATWTSRASGPGNDTLYFPIMSMPPVPLQNLRLVFVSQLDNIGNTEIYRMKGDGSAQTQLTNTSTNNQDPAWSPDSQRIAFASNRTGGWEIYVMQADGSGQTRLTTNMQTANPQWSPDGKRLLFVSNSTGNQEIYTINPDGSSQVNLTNNPANDDYPAWSPDGQQIAFSSGRDGIMQLYLMQADGSAPTRLTNNDISSRMSTRPGWSPDGTRIAFSADKNLYVIRLSDRTTIRLTNFIPTLMSSMGTPQWSPDGAKLLFTFCTCLIPAEGPQVQVIHADGSDVQPKDIGMGGLPSWSPDGAHIVFNTRNYPAGVYARIVVVNADGTPEITLTDAQHNSFDAMWSPIVVASP